MQDKVNVINFLSGFSSKGQFTINYLSMRGFTFRIKMSMCLKMCSEHADIFPSIQSVQQGSQHSVYLIQVRSNFLCSSLTSNMNKQPAFCREAEQRIFERRWSSFSSVHLRNISSQRRGLGRRSLKNTIGSPITTSMGKQTALENSTYYSMAGTQRLYSSNYMYWLVGKLMAFQ